MEYIHEGKVVYTESNRLEFLAENVTLWETLLHRTQQLVFNAFQKF
jgi:hypothetical protein